MNRDWSRIDLDAGCRRGSAGCDLVEPRLDARRRPATVLVPDCFWTIRLTALRAVEAAPGVRGSSTQSSTRPMSRDADRVAVAVGDDQLVEVVGASSTRPSVRSTSSRAPWSTRPPGSSRFCAAQRRAHVLDRQARTAASWSGSTMTLIARSRPPTRSTAPTPGQRLEVLLDLLAGDLGHLAQVAPAGDGDAS